jgi:hypothetical protein
MFIHVGRAGALLVLSALALLGCSVASSANDAPSPTSTQRARLTAALPGNDPCIVYTYDANGNRSSQTITVSGGAMTPTWGTGVWGCFKWTP